MAMLQIAMNELFFVGAHNWPMLSRKNVIARR